MIKVIKHGKKPKEKKTIYSICCSCGCVFEFEVEDFEMIERSLDGKAKIHCPDCNKEYFKKRNEYTQRTVEVD